MKKINSDILNEVKKSVGSETSNHKKQKFSKATESSELDTKIKLMVDKWLEENAERVAKEILKKEISKLFK